jgi:hypothetical protein
MGFRTVVVLSNDLAHEWEKDPELGRKIWAAAASNGREDLRYGSIVEQVHADAQTLAVLDSYNGKAVAYSHWHHGQSPEARDLSLLKDMAEKMGYKVVKKAKKG